MPYVSNLRKGLERMFWSLFALIEHISVVQKKEEGKKNTIKVQKSNSPVFSSVLARRVMSALRAPV